MLAFLFPHSHSRDVCRVTTSSLVFDLLHSPSIISKCHSISHENCLLISFHHQSCKRCAKLTLSRSRAGQHGGKFYGVWTWICRWHFSPRACFGRAAIIFYCSFFFRLKMHEALLGCLLMFRKLFHFVLPDNFIVWKRVLSRAIRRSSYHKKHLFANTIMKQ